MPVMLQIQNHCSRCCCASLLQTLLQVQKHTLSTCLARPLAPSTLIISQQAGCCEGTTSVMITTAPSPPTLTPAPLPLCPRPGQLMLRPVPGLMVLLPGLHLLHIAALQNTSVTD